MHYHVARNGHQMGQIEEAELKAGFLDGRYLPTDLVWREGMPEWKPLGEMKWPGPDSPVPKEPTRVSGPKPEFLSKPIPRGAATRAYPAAAALPVGAPPASGLATTSLVSGIVSILLCGLGGIASLVAIICGHKALSRINLSGGVAAGRGMAVAGLIMGYISLLFVIITYIAIFASLSLPVFSKIQEKAKITLQINQARQIQMACLTYAADNQGKYPASLEELVEKGLLDAGVLQEASEFKVPGWEGEPGLEYLGAGLDSTVPLDTPILISNAEDRRGQRVIARHDGSVMLNTLEQ